MKKTVFLILVVITFCYCKDSSEVITSPQIDFLAGEYTLDGDIVPLGGKLSFGVKVISTDLPITNIRVQRIADGITIVEVDRGMYFTEGELDYKLTAVKSSAEVEEWVFMVMNSSRDSAKTSLTIHLGEGADWGSIKHFSSLKIGMQNNTEYPYFLDLNTGNLFTNQTVSGNEAAIDLLGFVYFTGGVMSPTLSCPQYSTVPGYYPTVANWNIRNSTLYDYNSVDNNLVDPLEFENAFNDSLLVVSYRPANTSGNCKFCFTGKIIPFKTQGGKYGLIRVIHADVIPEGYMELEVKIQE